MFGIGGIILTLGEDFLNRPGIVSFMNVSLSCFYEFYAFSVKILPPVFWLFLSTVLLVLPLCFWVLASYIEIEYWINCLKMDSKLLKMS